MGKTEPTEYSENGINAKFPFQPISVSAIMKKLKNGCHFVNIDCTLKFQITNSKFFNFSPNFYLVRFSSDIRFGSDIYEWLWLKHLCVDIHA